MEYCAPLGLPYSQFLAWDEGDQDAAVAWIIHSRTRCPDCGTFPDEWWEYINDVDRLPRDPPPYMAGTTFCLGCATLGEEERNIPEGRRAQYRLHLTPWRPLTAEELADMMRVEDPSEELE